MRPLAALQSELKSSTLKFGAEGNFGLLGQIDTEHRGWRPKSSFNY